MPDRKPTLTVKQAAELSGLSVHILRIWERRYQAVNPQRSESHQRLYSRADIERLRLLRLLTKGHGHAISKIAGLAESELRALAAKEVEAGLPVRPTSPDRADLKRLLATVQNLDLLELSNLLTSRRMEHGARRFVLDLVSPFMRIIGLEVLAGRLTIAHEHAVSSLIKEQLYQIHIAARGAANGQACHGRLVAASMEGDFHSIGVLAAIVLASISGFGTHHLGVNTPPRALILAANALAADYVVVGRVPLPPKTLASSPAEYVAVLREGLPSHCQLVLGGRWDDIEPSSDFVCLADLDEFDDWLRMKSQEFQKSG